MILGIESSCDESSIALLDPAAGVIDTRTQSQIDLHRVYGGVVPELATREHLRNFPPLLTWFQENFELSAVEAIAVTRGPGLAGCLAIGIATAKALALDWNVPLYGINHLRGHAFSPFIQLHASDPGDFARHLAGNLPHLGLVVSGGNTLLVRVDTDGNLTILAETVDDAAGEALDKGAKLLGLPYPGGPEIESRAIHGNPAAWDFPRAFENPADHRFSFSGLKTSLRYTLEKLDDEALTAAMADLCASFQAAVVDQLARKLRQIARRNECRSIGLSGGVANNRQLRERIRDEAARIRVPLHVAPAAYTGDNAAMIAFAAMIEAPERPLPAGLDLPLDPSLPVTEF